MHLAYAYSMALPAPVAAPIQILNTCRAAAELGADVTVLVERLDASETDALAYYGLAPHERLRIVPLGRRPSPGRPDRCFRRAIRTACDAGPAAVVARGDWGARVARALGRRRSCRFVYESHRTLADRRLERIALERADGLVCASRGVQQELERRFGFRRPALFLPSGTAIPGPPPAGERDIDVIYAGKLRGMKGVRVAVEAMRLLPGYRLWMLGGSPAEIAALADFAGERAVADRVTLAGFVPPVQVAAYHARARVGVCPYPSLRRDKAGEPYDYGASLKLVELLAHGVPAVASDLPWIRELVGEPGDAAWLVRPDDPAALAEGIRTLLEQPELARALSARGRRHALGFSWERRAARLLEFVASL